MKEKVLMLLACLWLTVGLAMAQNSRVTGIVTSAEGGEPVIGASVLVEGTTVGAITDIDGNFVIDKVPANAKSLIVSYIGMVTQRVEIKPGRLVVVMRTDSKTLDEVVVTALGMKRSEKTLGYSASTVKSEKLDVAKSGSVMGGLAGKVAGVQISSAGVAGGSQKVLIRGISSLNSNTPLYIVDGVPIDNSRNGNNSGDFGNGANDINSEDVVYKQTYRFYRQFISYENEGVAHNDLQMFYFVLILKDLSRRGFVFDRSDTAYNRNIWSFSDSQFEIKLSFDKNNFGFDLVIFDRFSNETARHMLLLSPTISFSEIKEPEIKAWDTVEALSLWNRVDIEDHNKQPFEKIRTEAQLVGEWLDDKLAYSIANQDVYSHYCPVCKSKNIDIKNGVHTCQRCKSQYVFTHNKTRNTVLWFTKLRRIK